MNNNLNNRNMTDTNIDTDTDTNLTDFNNDLSEKEELVKEEKILDERQEKVHLLLEKNRVMEIKSLLKGLHPYDAAEVLDDLSEDEFTKLFNMLTPAESADLLEYIPEEQAASILENLSHETAARDLAEMEADDAADVLQILPQEELDTYLSYMNKEDKEDLKELASYDEDTAGALMTTSYITIEAEMSVSVAMKSVVKQANDRETIDTLFIIDKREKLKGIISLKKLIISPQTALVKDVMNSAFHYALVDTHASDAVRIMNDYDLLVLPVLENGLLKGVITADDAAQYYVESADEDYAKLAGMSDQQHESVWATLKARLPWLVILLVISYVISLIMDSFSGVMASCSALVFFQSLILDMGGNAGTQSLALTVVAVSQKKLTAKEAHQKALKELLVGVINGLILGIMAFFLCWCVLAILKINDSVHLNNIQVALCIGIAMSVGVICADVVGFLIPYILNKLGKDPAAASGPLITTINDVVGVGVYYCVAALLLGGLV